MQPSFSNRSKGRVNSLAKGLEILSLFAEGSLLGNQELVQRTGLPKATVSRITSTLVALGYLRVDAQSRKLLMGSRLVGMVASVQRRHGLQRVARPFMEKLSTELDLTVSLATRDRLGMVVLEVMRPPRHTLLVTNVDAGTVLPLPTTALGLAYVVAAPLQEQTQILEGLSRRHPADWPQLRQSIERAHREYARHGYVLTQRSWGRDVNGVAVPLVLASSKVLYTFHCAGPSSQMSLTFMRREAGPRLIRMVEDVHGALARARTPRLAPPEIHQP